MTDTMSDTYETIDSAGNVSFDFTGIIHALGLTLDEVPLSSVTAAQEIAWVDPATGLIWQFVNGYGDAATASVLRLVALQRAGGLSTQVVAQVQTFPIGVGIVRSKVILDNAGNSDFVMNSLLTAAGDLIYASAAQAPARLAVGTRGGLLAAQGASTLPAWTAPAANGAIPLGQNGGDLSWLAAGAAGTVVTGNGAGVNPSFQAIPAVALTNGMNKLGADVAMTNANTFYDGPTATLTAGTWMIVATLTLLQAATNGQFTVKLWDGTTVAASTEFRSQAVSMVGTATVSAIVTPSGTTTYKLSAANTIAGCTIKASAPDNGAGLNASCLTAIKIA